MISYIKTFWLAVTRPKSPAEIEQEASRLLESLETRGALFSRGRKRRLTKETIEEEIDAVSREEPGPLEESKNIEGKKRAVQIFRDRVTIREGFLMLVTLLTLIWSFIILAIPANEYAKQAAAGWAGLLFGYWFRGAKNEKSR